jgi:surface antigen
MRHRISKFLCTAMISLSVLASSLAIADPPDHAKAHGWRKKNDPRYVGYTGRDWERDYGVLEGNCSRKEIGTVAGAIVGGAIGSQIGDGNGRTVAIILGSVLGGIVGREIGRDLDDADRACVGHTLELVDVGRSVHWVNERTKVSYLLTPLAGGSGDSKNCRRYTLKTTFQAKARTSEGRACRDESGAWKTG